MIILFKLIVPCCNESIDCGGFFRVCFLSQQVQPEDEEHESMANISEHHAEEERKRDDAEICWIDFSVSRDSIGVDDFLEWHCEFVLLEFSRWFDGVVFNFVELSCLELI